MGNYDCVGITIGRRCGLRRIKDEASVSFLKERDATCRESLLEIFGAGSNHIQRTCYHNRTHKKNIGGNYKLDQKKKIDSILEKTAEQLTGLVDVNTVIGKPVFSASGAQIIPFTKVTMGYLSGGGEYGEVKAIKEDEAFPFAGGAGTVINIKPAGFLIDDGKDCRIVRITDDPLDGIIEKAGELVGKIIRKSEENEE